MLLSVFFLSGALAACDHRSVLSLTTPQDMEALSGSCLRIPCTFTPPVKAFGGQRPIFGVWIKNDVRFVTYPENVIFNSSGIVTTYPMNITGNLSQKDCTTLFSNLTTSHTDIYFFRIENLPLKATAHCDPLQITVKDSPPSPTVEIPGDLKEGQSVTITCSASTPCPHSPPELTWTLQQDSRSTTEENTDGTLTTKIQQTITLSDAHDGSIITCSAGYPVNEGKDVRTAETEVTLSVSYPPKDVSLLVSPAGPVFVGSMVNLTCSCRAKPPVVNFVWFMTGDGRLEMLKVDTQVYGFEVTNEDRERLFYCGCRNDRDTQLSKGRQLTFERDGGIQVGVQVIVKTLGIIMLISALVIIECWFRSRRSNKPVTESCQMSSGASLPNS